MAREKVYAVLISRPHEDAEVAVCARYIEIARGFLKTEVINFYNSNVDGNEDDMFESAEEYFDKNINQFGDDFLDEYFSDGTRFYIQEVDLW